MLDEYSLNDRQRRTCRLFALLFLAVAAAISLATLASLIVPGTLGMKVRCTGLDCAVSRKPDFLLPDSQQAIVAASPAAAARFAAHLEQPSTRLMLAAIETMRRLPIITLFAFVAIAMRRLGGQGTGGYMQAVPWLRRASLAAFAAALVSPLGDSLRATLLVDGVAPFRGLYVDFNFSRFVGDLLLAAAAWTATWAIAAGSKASHDMAEIV